MEDRPRLVHRLDRDTSGVLLLARTPGVAAKLAAAFRGRDVEKTYWAVVVGRPVPVEGRIDMKLTRVRGIRGDWTAPALPEEEDGVTAVTDYETLDATGKHFSLMALRPLTGRMPNRAYACPGSARAPFARPFSRRFETTCIEQPRGDSAGGWSH